MTVEPVLPGSPPRWIFVLELSYLVALIAIAVLYNNWDDARRLVHDPIGPVPLAVPWWGAVGGATISLTGIFRNAKTWDSSYHKWHIARPGLGAVVGTVGYLIYVVVIHTTGSTIETGSVNARATADLVAFVVGYREDLFRALLKRATDALFAPRDADD